ncbi:hypothetical protein NQZ79_g8154 [Umbelopsis isabellina]|nr:hypothetical protein NQZ79_g8154 [Umbelopsis isabellina]
MVMFKSVIAICLATTALTIAAPTSNSHTSSHKNQVVPGKYFDHFMVVLLENENYDDVVADPYLGNLAKAHKGNLLTDYYALTHPSQPNYIGIIGGSLFGFDDDDPKDIDEKSIVDILEPKGLTWREYAEDYTPGPGGACNTSTSLGDGIYMRKHNPFISYTTVANNITRCQNVVPATQLYKDIADGNLPQFSFYTPNMNNDGHDTNLTTASKWVQSFVEPLMNEPKFLQNTAVLLTWDEARVYTIPNQVWSVLIGDAVKPSANNSDNTRYDHYSILATIEANWDLDNLDQNDVNATVFHW